MARISVLISKENPPLAEDNSAKTCFNEHLNEKLLSTQKQSSKVAVSKVISK